MKKNVLTFLLSLFIAFGLWFYVVTVVNPEFEDSCFDGANTPKAEPFRKSDFCAGCDHL